jgi:hypothetical protein
MVTGIALSVNHDSALVMAIAFAINLESAHFLPLHLLREVFIPCPVYSASLHQNKEVRQRDSAHFFPFFLIWYQR